MSESCRFTLRLVPNASRDEVVGWLGEALKVKVRAPALEGRANASLCALLASALGLNGNSVTLVQGSKGRTKVVEIRGLSLEAVRARLCGSLKPRGRTPPQGLAV